MTERSRLHELLVVAGLTGFAFTQPLLSVLGENPTLFARYRVTEGSLVLFVVLVGLVPPLLIWGVGALVGLFDRRSGAVVHVVTVAILVALTAARLLRDAGLRPNAIVVPLAVAAGVLFAIAYERLIPMSLWARFTSPLPLLAIALFLFASPAGALATSGDSAGDGDRSGAPVVFVVLDELPTLSVLDADGGLDADRFPHLARFAEDATWYRHYTTVAPTTVTAVPAILSGRVPAGTLAVAEAHPDNLFTLLDPTHDLVVAEHSTALCTFDACEDPTPSPDNAGMGGLFDLALDLWAFGVGWGAPQDDDDDVVARAFDWDEFLEGQEARAAPERVRSLVESFGARPPSTLHYLHLMVPHFPWVTWPDGSEYREPDVLGLGLPARDQERRYTWSAAEAAVSEQRHLLQAQNTDRLVGEILDGLRAADLYDRALVVIVADHGVSFSTGAHGRLPTDATLDGIAYAPLFVKEPGQTEGRIDDANVTGVDVLPTVAAALELEVPWEVDGLAAGSPLIAERGSTKPFYFVGGLYNETIEEVGTFDDAATFPDPADRWIGPLADPGDPLSGLSVRLGVEDRLGTRFASLGARPEGTVAIHSLDQIVDPPVGSAPMKVVQAQIVAGPDLGTAVLAVDGTIVAAGQLARGADGVARVSMILPQDVQPSRSGLQFGVVLRGGAQELTITG